MSRSVGAWAELGQQILGGLAGWKVDSGDVPDMILLGRASQLVWVGQHLHEFVHLSTSVSNRLVCLLLGKAMH